MSILFKALGADTEEQALEALNKVLNTISDMRAATGAENVEDALKTVKQSIAFAGAVSAACGGKSGDEALAAIRQSAEDAQAKPSLDKVLSAVGEPNVDAALGSIATAKAARDELLPKAQAELDAQKKASEEAESAALLAELKKDPQNVRITPAQEADLWPSLSLEGKRAFAKTAPPINSSAQKTPSEPAVAADTLLLHGGKSYADMSFSERAELKKANVTKFNAMKADFESKS